MLIREWDEVNDIVVTDCPPMFPLETAKKYEISVFCVNTAKGIFYQRKYRGSYCLVNVTADGETTVLKKAFVVASNQQYTCLIVHDEKDGKNYLIDTRGEMYILPYREPSLFLGLAQYDFSLDKTTGYYKIIDRDITVWKIAAMSKEQVSNYNAQIAPDESLTVNNEFVKFFRKRIFAKRDTHRYIYYTCGSNKQGKIVEWLMKNGLPYEIVPNIFADDETLNIRIQLNEKNVTRTDVRYLFSKLRGTYSIFGISLDTILSAMDLTLAEKHEYFSALPSLSNAQEIMCHSTINTLKLLFKMETDVQVYNDIFKTILSTSYIGGTLNQQLVFQNNMSGDVDLTTLQKQCDSEKEYFQEYESALLAEMKNNGITISKWVNETAMFSLVHKHFPDAIYQYRVSWLGKQSFDVYVPSIKTAFEYQGIQHFKPIDHFGGEEKFKELQQRDAKKFALCKKHGVRIIYWNYDEPVSDRIYKQKMGELDEA